MIIRYHAKLIMSNGTFVELPYVWDTIKQAHKGIACWVAPEVEGVIQENITGFQVYKEQID